MPNSLPNTNSLVSRVWAMFPSDLPEFASPPLSGDNGGPAERSWRETQAHLMRGDANLARERAKEAIALSVRTGDRETLRRAMVADVKALLMQGDFGEAEHVVELVEAAADPESLVARAEALEIRGWWLSRVGTWGGRDFEDGCRISGEAEAIYSRLGDWQGVARALETRAWSEFGLGDYPRALETLEEGVEICVKHRVPHRLHRLALLTALAGKDAGYEEFGLRAFPRVIAWCEAEGDQTTLARAMIGYASVLAHRAEIDPIRACEAERLLRGVVEMAGPLGLSGLELEARTALIALLRRAHEPERAEVERASMEALAERLPSRQILELLYREREQQTIFNDKLRRQVARLQDTLESSEDAILVFEPRRRSDGAVDDFICDIGNDAATRLLHLNGNGVFILPGVARPALLEAADRMLRACAETGEIQSDSLEIEVDGELRSFNRRVVPTLPGAAICIRDVTDRKRWERQLEETMVETLARSLVLETRQQELLEVNRRLDHLAMTDGLTGLLNHRAFQERLNEELHRAHRQGTPLSLIMLDVDHFKRFNDDLGHQAGDRVLREVARALSDLARNYDSVARYGGEEFTVILPGTDAEAATGIAERMRARIAGLGADRYILTASFGVASLGPVAPTQEALIASADRALFDSKQLGRNRVTHASPASSRGNI